MSLGAVRGRRHRLGHNGCGCHFAEDRGSFFWRTGNCFDNWGWSKLWRCGDFRHRGCKSRRRGSFCCRNCGGGRYGFGKSNRSRGGWLNGCRLGRRARVSFAYRMSGWRGCWRLDHHGHRWRHPCACRTRSNHNACRSLGDNRARGRAAGDGGWRRGNDNGRRGAGLGNNLARFRTNRGRGWRDYGDDWSRRPCRGRRGGGNRRRSRRLHMAGTRRCFIFLLFGQNGLEHITRLGDMREINLGRHALRGARCL